LSTYPESAGVSASVLSAMGTSLPQTTDDDHGYAPDECQREEILGGETQRSGKPRASARQVPSDKLVVFATDSYSDQAVLPSSIHQIWAITYGSMLGAGVVNTRSTVFEPFPRPEASYDLKGTDIFQTLNVARSWPSVNLIWLDSTTWQMTRNLRKHAAQT